MKITGVSPLILLSLLLPVGAQAQPAATEAPMGAMPLRTLIISGGPDFEYNQYAIESNARYVEKLTDNSRWRRVHFADGKAASPTISVIPDTPQLRADRALAWMLGEEQPQTQLVAQISGLRHIDGSATKPAVEGALAAFARAPQGEQGLLYITGHGGAGEKPGLMGREARPDYLNTTYALWNDDEITAREVAGALKNWPARNPLMVVMVQCHSGGFANLIFRDSDPRGPVLDRDVVGFFSTTGERLAAGCTSEVNERDYQDFTTHFFAALAGTSRDGRTISGADYDRNGAVSGSEAFAWANVHDLSIDVPVSTSDTYLRAVYADDDKSWQQTPYSTVLASAQPWQKAMLNQLSSALNLTGETRIVDAIRAFNLSKKASENENDGAMADTATNRALMMRAGQLETRLKAQFPGLKKAPDSASYRAARAGAMRWLVAHPAELTAFNSALNAAYAGAESSEVRQAMWERFVRGAYTVILGARLQRDGTPEQRAIFARLRAGEARNPLR